MAEKIGVLVNTDKHLDDIVGFVQVAVDSGKQVSLFMMDDGTMLAGDLHDKLSDKVELTLCDHSAREKGAGPVEGVASSSQFQNAVMMHDSDKVVVF